MRIDAHLHLNHGIRIDEEINLIIINLDAAGFDKACLLPSFPAHNNEDILYAVKRYPDKFFGIFTFDFGDVESLVGDFERFISLGLRGIKLHPRFQNIDLKNNSVKEVLFLANNRNIPVIVDGFISDREEGIRHLDIIDNMADMLNKSKIIIAHFGGYRFKDVLPIVKNNDNVFVDLSFSLMHFDRKNPDAVTQMSYLVKEIGSSRFLYGSDYPAFGISESFNFTQTVLCAAGLNNEEMSQVMGETALKIFESDE